MRAASRGAPRVLALALLCVLLLSPSPVAAFGELEGTHLRGCVLEEDPYIVADRFRRSGYSGIAMEYLQRLQENLAFTMSFVPWNDSWSAFIDEMAVCDPSSSAPPAERCTCDIGIGSFTVTNERVQKITFVWPLSNEDHRMVSRKSDLRVDASKEKWFVFHTFSWQVWLVIAAGILMHAVGTVFFGPFRRPGATRSAFSRDESFSRENIMWKIKRFPAAILYAYAHLVGNPFGERSQGTPSFHRTAWLVLGITTGLFLLTVYEASLTVLLFESTKDSPFSTLSDFTECALSPARVAVIRGGASQSFWNNAVNTTEIQTKCSHGPVGVEVRNLEDGFNAVADGRADYFFSLGGGVLFRAHRSCDTFEQVGEPFFSTAVAFVLPRVANATVLEHLSRSTRLLREEDEYSSASLLAARNACDAVVDAKITFGKLWAFFVLYAVCWSSLLLYRCVFLWRKRDLPGKDKVSEDGDVTAGGPIVMMDMHSMPTRSLPSLPIPDSMDRYEEYLRGIMPQVSPQVPPYSPSGGGLTTRRSVVDIPGVKLDVTGHDYPGMYSVPPPTPQGMYSPPPPTSHGTYVAPPPTAHGTYRPRSPAPQGKQ